MMKNFRQKGGVFALLTLGLLLSASGAAVESEIIRTTTAYNLADNTETVEIDLNGDAISVSSPTVEVSGTTVVIKTGGTYRVGGSLEDGRIIVNAAEKDVQLVLNGVDLTSTAGPVIYVYESKDTEIVLAENTTNVLTDGSKYTDFDFEEDNPNATIYSMSDLKITGAIGARLQVRGLYNDGIVSKDDLTIKNVELEIVAEDDGIRGKDSIEIKNSRLVLEAGGDALKSDNEEDESEGVIQIEESELIIVAGDDGIHAVSLVEILSGEIEIRESLEGIESKVISVYAGEVSVTASDDGLNVSGEGGLGGNSVLSGGELNIYGGNIMINAGGDGFDSNGNATMTAGTLIVNGPTKDNNGSIDVNGMFDVSGGMVLAIGSAGMAETPSATSSQPSFQVNFESMQSAGTVVSIVNAVGEEILAYEAIKQFQSVVYSDESLVLGETYTFLLDGEKYVSVTLEGVVTTYGEVSENSGPGKKFQ